MPERGAERTNGNLTATRAAAHAPRVRMSEAGAEQVGPLPLTSQGTVRSPLDYGSLQAHSVRMRVTAVEWDRLNLRHFDEHGRCRRDEVHEVLQARCYPTRAVVLDREAGAEPRLLFYGRTCAGRYLAVVAAPRPGGVMRPITCWPLSEKSAKTYEAWRKTVKR
jgi:uncharacterized DUF497 family protein